MKPYTIDELVTELRKLQIRGYGEHIVLVSDDDECNGHHPLFGWAFEEGEPIEYLNAENNKMEMAPTILIG